MNPYVFQELAKLLVVQLPHGVQAAHERKAVDAMLPCIPHQVQVLLDIVCAIADADDIDAGVLVYELRDHLAEDVVDMFLGVLVALNQVTLHDQITVMHGASRGHAVEGGVGEGQFSFGPPDQLAHVGQDDARRAGVGDRGALLLQLGDDGYEGALVDATGAADDAVGEYTKILQRLPEDNDDAFLEGQVAADEDGDVRLRGILGADGQEFLLHTELLQTIVNLVSERL